MARTKEQLEETLPLVSETADVHHIIRSLADKDLPQGAINPDKADAYIRSWLQQGYRLHTVVTLGTADVNGTYVAHILYILIKD